MFVDLFVGCGASQRFQSSREIVGKDEVDEVDLELTMIFAMEALDGRPFNGSVHPLDLPVGPGGLHLGQPVFDIIVDSHAIKMVPQHVAVGQLRYRRGR